MAAAGFSPSVRLFEAAACGTPIVSDAWEGIETLLRPESEILLASGADDVLAALATPEPQRREIAGAARRRILVGHSSAHRAAELERHLTERHVRAAARVC
ncbi:MAG: glycosyltransferase [Amaricoccus sp.]